MVSLQQEFLCLLFKSHRPIEWLDFMTAPGIGMQVMNEVSAANYQHALIA